MPEISPRLSLTRRAALSGALLTAGALTLPTRANAATPATDLEQQALQLQPPAFLFETAVPDQVSAGAGSTLTITDRAARCGTRSLRWDYSPGSAVTIRADLNFTPDAYRPGQLPGSDQCWQGVVDTFSVWLYNETPIDDVVRFEFGNGPRAAAWFEFRLNFTGWRTAWVRYGYDLEGRPQPGMDTVRLIAPRRTGTLYVDQLVLNMDLRPDQPTRDEQVPFVALETDDGDNSHWQALYLFDQLLTSNRPATPAPSAVELDSLQALVTRYHDDFLVPTSSSTVQVLAAQVDALGVPSRDSLGGGRPIVSYQAGVYPPAIAADLKTFVNAAALKDYTTLMKQLAQAYALRPADRPALAELYLRIVVHLRDQGWQRGSTQGTIHHFGYDGRGWYDSVYLMRDVLRDAGLLDAVRADVTWFSGLGRLFRSWDDRQAYGGTMDILNTTVQGMVPAILLRDSVAEQIAYLHALQTWLSKALLPSAGIQDGVKVDGTSFHHIGFYPDYSRDGLNGVAPFVYMLSGGAFRISQPAHESLKHVLLTMRTYANAVNWPLSITGRHPTGLTGMSLNAYVWAALAGTPDGSSDVDPELTAALLRLLPAQPSTGPRLLLNRLKARNIPAEPTPDGNWALNYAALSLHRRADWMVSVRGHNRYLWSTEIYDGSNWYGRYSTYGQIQVQSRGNPVTNVASGFNQNGWNWNRWPGTTAINLPLPALKADLTGVIEEMLLTDSAFAGAHTIDDRHGMFAMRLHEHPKYDGSHRALKSVFCFDDRIVAVGTGIANTDRVNETETTLFQTALATPDAPTYLGDTVPVTSFPYECTDVRSRWLLDDKGIGYYLPAGQRVSLSRTTQESRDQGTDQPTTGDFATAWIRHGTAPRDAGYEYAMLVDATPASMAEFAAAMADPGTAPYEVLRADTVAHVVADRATGITGYALFEPTRDLNAGPVREVDTPSMLLTRAEGNDLVLAVCDPDLHLYDGRDPDQYQGNTYVGRYTSFSRPWQTNPSQPHRLTVVVSGHWQAGADQPCRATPDGTATRIEFDTADGRPVQVRLTPLGASSTD
ncbi:chondroitinase family polysaccharide lyase [Kribbella sp.]|uniref:chondroitinase family polysaccharide lyase n=1 Tax=Kribbella sp. TaxID=1871183 RepID=UPI002D37BACE|nr:chondroitinase family polysaccharide lyase [Kribbella sp.]HZX07129.1 chondroitinase family polysaccharide lyase [Kribbella sp.]